MKRNALKPTLKALCLTGILLGFSPVFAQQESNDFSYALKLFNEGFYDISAQQFTTFVNRYPNSERLPEARYYLGDALFRLDEIDNARIEFQAMAVSFPEHNRAPQGWFRVGECYQKLGKLEAAAKSYETVKILYPDNSLAPRALLEAGEALKDVGQYARAEQVIREFLNRYIEAPEYAQGRVLYGDILFAKGEPERANNEYESVLQTPSNPGVLAAAHLGQAAVFRELGFASRAETALRAVLARKPDEAISYRASTELAGLYIEGREWDQAIKLLREYDGKYSDRDRKETLKLLLAQAYYLKGDYFQARSAAESLIDSREAGVAQTARFYTAACQLAEKRYDAAIANFQLLIEVSANPAGNARFYGPSQRGLLQLHLDTGELDAAREILRQLQAAAPGDAGIEPMHRRLVRQSFVSNQISAGVDELQRYRGSYPDAQSRDELIFEAGKAYFRNQQYERSLLFFEQVLDEYPASSAWDSSRVYHQFIQNHYASAQQSGVREMARLMSKMFTGVDRKQLLFELGKIYLNNLRDYSEAGLIFERFIAEAADSAAAGEGWYYLAQSQLRAAEKTAFSRSGRPESSDVAQNNAIETLKRAMTYVRFAPHPDTLTFQFLSKTAGLASTPPENFIKYWQVFEQRYPGSTYLPLVKLQLAEANHTLGKNEASLASLKGISSANADPLVAGTVQRMRADNLFDAGRSAEAVQALKDFLLNYPRHPDQARGYARLGTYYQLAGDPETAAQFFERLVKLYNYADEAPSAREKAIENFLAAGDDERVLAFVLPQVQKHQPEKDPILARYTSSPAPELYFFAGNAYYRRGDYKESRQQLMDYLRLAPPRQRQSDALLLLGSMARSEGDPESALLQLSLIKKDENPTVFYQASAISADILLNGGKFAEALQKYDMLIAEQPQSGQLMEFEGRRLRCLVRLGKTTDLNTQSKVFNNKYKNQPGSDNHLAAVEYESAMMNYESKSFDQSINHCKSILSKYKKTEFADDAQYLIGRNYATLNKGEKALDEFDKFLNNFPKSDLAANVYLTIAEIHFRNDDTEPGVAAVRQAVAVAQNPEAEERALASLVNTYKSLQLWDGALQNARSYVNKFPNAKDLIDQKINIGVALIRLNRYTEAVDYLKTLKYEVDSEQEPEIQFYVGEAYYNAGQYEKAINEFVKIPLLSQKTKLQWEASALYFAGQSYEKLGRAAEAMRMYQEIIDRPGIQLELKRQARKLIDNLKSLN